MSWKEEWKPFAWLAAAFLAAYFLPVGEGRFDHAVLESLYLVRDYAREHVLLCLIPAFFIAGTISVFISQASVMRYLGAGAPKPLAYGVASVSGTVLAVCSCTVLPLFAGIYRMGAGLGPATAFLYAGPAINVLAIALTARVLGLEMGIARAVGAVLFSLVIGLLMHLFFRREETARQAAAPAPLPEDGTGRPLWQSAAFLAAQVAFLIFANWGRPAAPAGLWATVFQAKWWLSGASLGLVALMIWRWFSAEELKEWLAVTWGFARQITPLLLGGILVAGLLLGRPGEEGLIPSAWVARAVGGESWMATLLASVVGAFMYFATLTEVPILQGLIGSGMGKGPALALLLAGPALSLPSMLVLRSIMGTKKTAVYIVLVVAMATLSGLLYAAMAQRF